MFSLWITAMPRPETPFTFQTKDLRDKTARKKLILFYIVVFDNPEEAAGLLTDGIDKATRTHVSLAAAKLASLDKTACLKLGDWCYKTLSKKVSGALRPPLPRRAKGYYRRGLALPAPKTKDASQ